MSKKFINKLIPIILTSLVSLGGVGLVATEPAQADSIQVYNLEYNQHGRILRTSEGIFFIGRSGDAIQQISGSSYYGYWEQNNSVLYVYIGNLVYWFNL